ncbi:MAG: type II toxin-antitoxin system VapC family toxin [Alcaligenaceae bacterium]|nr:MAG: type II toxin-antitoxin system VapC family toxin [Alcaligenaceae bacterium]
MTRYLLDTNIASHVIKGDLPQVRMRLEAIPMQNIGISAVTQGELLYGVAKRGNPKGLHTLVHEFLSRVTVLPWDAEVAETYGHLRAQCERQGTPLGALDMMIAAHAHALNTRAQAAGTATVLVTRDKAFLRLPAGVTIEDWTHPA